MTVRCLSPFFNRLLVERELDGGILSCADLQFFEMRSACAPAENEAFAHEHPLPIDWRSRRSAPETRARLCQVADVNHLVYDVTRSYFERGEKPLKR